MNPTHHTESTNMNTKSHGYEALMLMLVAVATLMTLFVAVFHQLNIDLTPSFKTLFHMMNQKNN